MMPMLNPSRQRIPFPILTLLARAANAENQKPLHGTRLGSNNISFHYLYRDASNYKLRGTVIFTNQTFLPIQEIENQIHFFLKDGEFFIARQVLIEERFFDVLHEEVDHVWHEFDQVEITTEPAFDPENWNQHEHNRDITEFIGELDRANRAGWDEMNVRADVAKMLEGQKRELKRALGSGKDILK